VDVTLERANGVVRLSVADHGPGMSAEQAEHVFERFYRADPSRARTAGGAGLGLSIVAAVTEAHGGHASASSAGGGGATFTVELPLASS
jgi:two-component system OmpR family sensor kinase